MSKKKIYWVSRDGDRHDITKMSDEYLSNVLRHIELMSVIGVGYKERVLVDTGYDGDSYMSDYMYITGKIFGDDVLNHFNYNEMVNELNKRKV